MGAGNHPVLVAPGEWTTIARAAKRVSRSEATIRRWIKMHGISRQSCRSAPHEVNILALEMVRHGDEAALALLRSSDFEHPAVRRYVDVLRGSTPFDQRLP